MPVVHTPLDVLNMRAHADVHEFAPPLFFFPYFVCLCMLMRLHMRFFLCVCLYLFFIVWVHTSCVGLTSLFIHYSADSFYPRT